MTRSKEDLAKLTVAELKAELKELGQPLTGRKDELIDRLLAAQDGPASEAPEPEAGAPEPAKEAPGTTEPAPAPAKTDAPATSNGTHEPAAAPADAPKDGKRPRIVFNEDALKQMPAKVTVVRPPDAPVIKTEAQKLKERAEKFKDPEIEKAKQRALRFGVSHPDLEKEKARKRAERFGITTEEMEEERKRQRAERFGIEDPEAKLAQRIARFGPVAAAAVNGAAKSGGDSKRAPIGAGAGAKKSGNAPKTIASTEFEKAKQARAERFGPLK